MQSSRKSMSAASALELIASLLEQGSIEDRAGEAFNDHAKLFLGSSKNPDLGPTMGLYFDASQERLAALPFGIQGGDLLMIPFNFDLDPPLSKAGKTARSHMLVLSAELRGGQRLPEFRAALSSFAQRAAQPRSA